MGRSCKLAHFTVKAAASNTKERERESAITCFKLAQAHAGGYSPVCGITSLPAKVCATVWLQLAESKSRSNITTGTIVAPNWHTSLHVNSPPSLHSLSLCLSFLAASGPWLSWVCASVASSRLLLPIDLAAPVSLLSARMPTSRSLSFARPLGLLEDIGSLCWPKRAPICSGRLTHSSVCFLFEYNSSLSVIQLYLIPTQLTISNFSRVSLKVLNKLLAASGAS